MEYWHIQQGKNFKFVSINIATGWTSHPSAKTADLALLSLFMRTNGKGNLQFSAYKRYSAFSQNPIFLTEFDFPCSDVFMLINVKIPTIFDILTFMSMINFMLS